MTQSRKVASKKSPARRKISQKQAKKLIEKVCPRLVKTPRLRNIVRRAIRKTKTKEFADKLDAVLVLTDKLQDLVEQATAEYPHAEIHRRQVDGTIAININDTAYLLATAWKKLLAQV